MSGKTKGLWVNHILEGPY